MNKKIRSLKQIIIPGVEEEEARQLNNKINEECIRLDHLINRLIDIRSPELQRNSIINLRFISSAIQCILNMQKCSRGIGAIILNRSKFSKQEKISARYIAINKSQLDSGHIETSKNERKILEHLFDPIDWDAIENDISDFDNENRIHNSIVSEESHRHDDFILKENERHEAVIRENEIVKHENIPHGLKEYDNQSI